MSTGLWVTSVDSVEQGSTIEGKDTKADEADGVDDGSDDTEGFSNNDINSSSYENIMAIVYVTVQVRYWYK